MSRTISYSEMLKGKNAYLVFIPLFIASVITGIFIVRYMSGELKPLVSQLSTTGSVIAFFTQLMAITTMLLWSISDVRRIKDWKDKSFYSSAVTLIIFIAFILLGLAEYPKLQAGKTFDMFYLYTAGYLSTSRSFNMWIAFAVMMVRYMRVNTIESAAYFVVLWGYLFRELTMLPGIWAPFAGIGTWVETALGAPAWRTLVIVAAVGAVLVAFRTLLMRERGIMEEEA